MPGLQAGQLPSMCQQDQGLKSGGGQRFRASSGGVPLPLASLPPHANIPGNSSPLSQGYGQALHPPVSAGGAALSPLSGQAVGSHEIPAISDSVLAREPHGLDGGVSDSDLSALFSHQDMATSIAEDLLAQFSHEPGTKKTLTTSASASITNVLTTTTTTTSATSPNGALCVHSKVAQSDNEAECEKRPNSAGAPCKSTDVKSENSPTTEYVCLLKTEKSEPVQQQEVKKVPQLSINMTGSDIVVACKGRGSCLSYNLIVICLKPTSTFVLNQLAQEWYYLSSLCRWLISVKPVFTSFTTVAELC